MPTSIVIALILHNIHRDLFNSSISICTFNSNGTVEIKSRIHDAGTTTTLEDASRALYDFAATAGYSPDIFVDEVAFDWDGYFPWKFTIPDWRDKENPPLVELLNRMFLNTQGFPTGYEVRTTENMH